MKWFSLFTLCMLPLFAEFGETVADLNISYDTFRGMPDGSWNGNTGGFGAANFGISLYEQVAIQLGGSYGIYDWSGRGSILNGNPKRIEQQTFLTAGLYRETPYCSGINVGIAYDWMLNENFGLFGLNPTIQQFRFKAGYLFWGSDELGVWGTVDTNHAHVNSDGIPLTFRSINQINFFWSHLFYNCAETTLWVGVPYKRSLMFTSGTAGEYLFGASFRVPLTCALSIEGHGAYMGAKWSHGITQSHNYDANICFGLTYTFCLFGDCCSIDRPYQPLANNSNFMVDTNLNN